jgi:hypothetical protein
MTTEITQAIATKVLETVDAGLCSGVGKPIPGEMCVEAAVCYALGLPHGDEPDCVAPPLRAFKIRLNDKNWSSNEARAKGLRRLALIQLGSKGHLDDREFAKRLAELAIRKAVPVALRAAASVQKDAKHKAALLKRALICERYGTWQVASDARKAAAAVYAADVAAYDAADVAAYDAAYAAAYAAYAAAAYAAYAADADAADAAAYAADTAAFAADAAKFSTRDKVLADFAEDVVQLLVEMDVPGKQWLDLAPLED